MTVQVSRLSCELYYERAQNEEVNFLFPVKPLNENRMAPGDWDHCHKEIVSFWLWEKFVLFLKSSFKFTSCFCVVLAHFSRTTPSGPLHSSCEKWKWAELLSFSVRLDNFLETLTSPFAVQPEKTWGENKTDRTAQKERFNRSAFPSGGSEWRPERKESVRLSFLIQIIQIKIWGMCRMSRETGQTFMSLSLIGTTDLRNTRNKPFL